MTIEKQTKIDSILNEVREGKLTPPPQNHVLKDYAVLKETEEYFKNLRYSLLEFGQLSPIYITIDKLDTENPVPIVLKGNTRLYIINKLREEGILKFLPNVEYCELPETKHAEFYAASTFIKKEFVALQKGMYGAIYLYAPVRKRAEDNQKAHVRTNMHIDTCREIGQMVGCCDKVVRLAYYLLQADNWFSQYILSESNDMSISEAKELVYYRDPELKKKIISAMKDFYEADKKANLNDGNSNSDKQYNEDEILKDEDLRKGFREVKSLYGRAKAKVLCKNLSPQEAEKRAKKKIQAANGGILPTAPKVNQAVEYVESYGNGDNNVTVDFKLPEQLAMVFSCACEQFNIKVTIKSTYNSSDELGRAA